MTNVLELGGRDARGILVGDRGITDRIIAAIASSNPEQHGTGSASRAADIRWVVEHNLRAAADALAGQRHDDELIRASAVRRFEEGSSFASVVNAYHRGVAVIWSELSAYAGDADSAALAECGQRLFGHLERIATTLAEDFERTWALSHAGERDARFVLFTALTQGGDAEGEAHRSGRTLSARYGVLVVRLESTAGDTPDDVLARRTTQRLRAAIDSAAAAEVLAVLGAAGGTALVPLAEGRRTAAELRAALRAGFGDACTSGWVEATVPEIPEAVGVAEELVDLGLAVRRRGELNTLDDLVLEYQSVRPGPGRTLLANRLERVGGTLLDTIDAYLDSGGDRRATAVALKVHPNTIDYRLGRVADLCGMDATTPEGAAQLRASRVATRLIAARRGAVDT